VYSEVEAVPLKSPVIFFPSAIVYVGQVHARVRLSSRERASVGDGKRGKETYRESGVLNFGGVFEEIHVTEHHDTGEEKCCGVGLTVNVASKNIVGSSLQRSARFCLTGIQRWKEKD